MLQATTPLAAMQKPTKEEIAQKIETMKKTIKGLKTINTTVTALTIGGAITGAVLALATVVGGAALVVITAGAGAPVAAAGAITAGAGAAGIAAGATATSAGTGTAAVAGAGTLASLAATAAALEVNAPVFATVGGATTAAGLIPTVQALLVSGIITALISGGLGTIGVALCGGLTAATLITALANAREIEKIEKEYPGSLTKDQATVVAQFKNMIKGPIGKGIATGIQIKKLQTSTVDNIFKNRPAIIAQVGGYQKAPAFIKNYLDLNRKLVNNIIANESYKIKKEALLKERDQHKKLSPKHIKIDLQILGLDLKFKPFTAKIEKQRKNIQKLHATYPGLEQGLAPYVKEFIEQVNDALLQLASPQK